MQYEIAVKKEVTLLKQMEFKEETHFMQKWWSTLTVFLSLVPLTTKCHG